MRRGDLREILRGGEEVPCFFQGDGKKLGSCEVIELHFITVVTLLGMFEWRDLWPFGDLQ